MIRAFPKVSALVVWVVLSSICFNAAPGALATVIGDERSPRFAQECLDSCRFVDGIKAFSLAIQKFPNVPGYYLKRGTCYYFSGDCVKALADIQAGLNILKTPQLWVLKGFVCLKQKKYNEADRCFFQAYKLESKNTSHEEASYVVPFLLSEVAYSAIQYGSFTEALTDLAYAKRLSPSNSRLNLYLSQVHTALKRPEKAQEDLLNWKELTAKRSASLQSYMPEADPLEDTIRCLKLDPQNFSLYKVRAQAFFAMGLYKFASSDLDKMHSLNPDDIETVKLRYKADELAAQQIKAELSACVQTVDRNDIYQRKADAALANNALLDAISYCNQGLIASPNNIALLAVRAKTYRKTGDKKKQMGDLNSILRIEPDNKMALSERARLYEETNQDAAALLDYNRLITQQPENLVALESRARIYEKQGDSANAGADYDALSLKNIRDKQFSQLAISSYLKSGNLNGAIKICTRVINTDSKNIEVLKTRAKLYEQNGEQELAKADLKKISAIENPTSAQTSTIPEVPVSKRATKTLSLAELSALIDKDPGDFKSYVLRGNLHIQAGQTKEALEDFNMAIKQQPDCFEALEGRAQLFANTGRATEAVKDFSACIRLSPMKAELYASRSQLYEKLGDLDKAVADLQQAKQLGAGAN